MKRADPSIGEVPHADFWRALVGRVAVVVGTLTALTALLYNAPASRASLRGGIALIATLALGRGCEWLQRRIHVPAPPDDRDEDPNASPETP